MVLKSQSLKNEMERALQEIPRGVGEFKVCKCCGQLDREGYKGPMIRVPKDARVGQRGVDEMLKWTRAFVFAVTKFAYSVADKETNRSTLIAAEIEVAVGAIKLADIMRELPKERETSGKEIYTG